MTAMTPAVSTRAQWWLGFLHGPSQIYFQQNVITGILVLAAFFVADWRMGILALLGCLGGILGGQACRFPLSSVGAGMQSFCGTLVGAAVFAALGGDNIWVYPLALVGGFVTGPVTWLVNALFTRTGLKVFNLPYTTAPFVIVATIIALSTAKYAVSSPLPHVTNDPLTAFGLSILTNVSQVVLVDNLWSGALILIGLFIAGWRVGLAALLGSVVGTLTAFFAGETMNEIANGLANYSGVLTAIALAVTFIKSSVWSWLYSVPWIIVTAIVTLVMHNAGVETYTWPYILTTWVALIVAHFIRGLKRS
ncbi:urea transporter [Microbacterium sp. ASV49]|uniref:Urea transporter n=1 Tax=Microbacterium candidum TaxID=3041922 RepID=A0ABT7MTE2_9MICO|nr:urea transporter [Microbacterium sp. ASV49]MDL9977721.1 urea transporter [Microbacterium sp. ASV49]